MNKLLFCALLLLAGAAIAQSACADDTARAAGFDGARREHFRAGRGARDAGRREMPAAAKPAATNTAAGAANNPAAKPGAAKPQAANKSNAKDRLDLESTQITGNRELPKVLYIVPWRSAEMGDLIGRPVNSLLDEVLEPVDRDVFRRQNRYFEALQPNEAAPTSKPEK